MFLARVAAVEREFKKMSATNRSQEKNEKNKKICSEVQELLNTELDSAVLRSNQKLWSHLTSCPECVGVWTYNLQIKEALQRAVKSEVAPEGLRAKLEKRFLKKD
jgi:anti-sigma factor (TIGR02949 family)